MWGNTVQMFCLQLCQWFSSLCWVSCLTHLCFKYSSLEWAWNCFSLTDKVLLEKYLCHSLGGIWERLLTPMQLVNTYHKQGCMWFCCVHWFIFNSTRNSKVDCLLWSLPLIKGSIVGFQLSWRSLAFSCCITCRFSWLTRIALHGVCILYQQKKCTYREI